MVSRTIRIRLGSLDSLVFATTLIALAPAPSACGGSPAAGGSASSAEGAAKPTAHLQASPLVTTESKKPRLVQGSAGVGRAFDITVPQAGLYHVRAWLMGVNGGGLVVYLDTQSQPVGTVARTDSGWHYHNVISATGAETLALPAGAHTLSFSSRGDDVPEVESLQFSTNTLPQGAEDENYTTYIAGLQAKSLPADYATKKATSSGGTTLGDLPSDNYCYSIGMSFSYSYRSSFYFSAGQSVVFETRKAGPYASDPVLYLFSSSNPEAASWSNDDYNGRQSRIAATIPTAGYYTLLARTYNPSSPGTSDLYKDGTLYASNIALAGNKLACSLNKTGMALNYFTSYLTGDSMLWVVDQASGNSTGLVGAFNDDYTVSSDFAWGKASRVHRTSSLVPTYAIITAYSALNPTGTADVYLENEDSDIMWAFPNLKAADAIKSAPSSSVYRCISYSGGVTTFYTWPPDPSDPWYNADPLTAFDNWYGNRPSRYSGAWTYTRNGATVSTSIVDLWALNGTYTHGSVKKPGNGWPHGYDWESKPGTLTRTFHPRHALRSQSAGSYGDVVAYYIWTGQTASAAGASKVAAAAGGRAMLTDALAAGVAVMEQPALTTAEASKLQTLKSALASSVSAQFERLYAAWRATWDRPELAILSNPDEFTKSREYSDLLQFCRQQKRQLWPLAFERHLAGDAFAFKLVQDLTLPELQAVLAGVRQESAQERYTADGKYVVPSLHANMTKFVQAALAQM